MSKLSTYNLRFIKEFVYSSVFNTYNSVVFDYSTGDIVLSFVGITLKKSTLAEVSWILLKKTWA